MPMSGAAAPSTEPTTTRLSATSSIRRLPYMSPSRPSSGAATAPATSVAVTSHVTVAGEACEQLREPRQQRHDEGLHQRDGQTARAQDADHERRAACGGGHPTR